MKNVILVQNDTMDNFIDKINVKDIQYIKIGDWQVLYEELELHGVPDEDIVNEFVLDVTEDVQVMRILMNDGKYHFYPLCDLYFE